MGGGPLVPVCESKKNLMSFVCNFSSCHPNRQYVVAPKIVNDVK